MKTDKEQVIDFINELPETISAETIVTELQFRLMVLRRGSEAAADEQLISHDEAKDRLGKWLNSPGT